MKGEERRNKRDDTYQQPMRPTHIEVSAYTQDGPEDDDPATGSNAIEGRGQHKMIEDSGKA